MNTLFDGSYKRKPLIDLGGRMKTEEKDSLLERVKKEREEREVLKSRVSAAVCLQAAYRGHRTRLAFKEHLRQVFRDKAGSLGLCSVDDLLRLSYIFLKFYNFHSDAQLLIVLCQRWLASRRAILSSPSLYTHLYILQRILGHCCHYLPRAGQRSIAVPFRMLEVFLNQDSYAGAPVGGNSKMGKILQFLVQKGYFFTLRCLLDAHVPPGDAPTLVPPTPLAAAVLQLMLFPLLQPQPDQKIVCSFLDEVLSHCSDSLHVNNLVLPLLRDKVNPITIISALVQVSHDGHVTLAMPVSFSVLHAILSLSTDSLSLMTAQQLSLYMNFMAAVLRSQTALSANKKCTEDSDDEDEVDPIITKGLFASPVVSPPSMYVECMQALNSGALAQVINRSGQTSEVLLDSLCQLCYQLICSHSIVPHASRLFQKLSLNKALITQLWRALLQMKVQELGGEMYSLLAQLKRGFSPPSSSSAVFFPRLTVFCALYALALLSIHDADFFIEQMSEQTMLSAGMFTKAQLVEMCLLMRDATVGVTLLLTQQKSSAMLLGVAKEAESGVALHEWDVLCSHMCKLLRYLHERDTRRKFCPDKLWVSPVLQYKPYELPLELFLDDDEDEDTPQFSTPVSVKPFFQLLKQVPFVFEFSDRVILFRKLIGQSRSTHQPLRGFNMGPSIKLDIKRETIYQDAFTQLAVDQDLRRPMYVRFTNQEGLEEAGIDGGGLFREFLTELLQMGFDPKRGFFKSSHERVLYPNPQVHVVSPDHKLHYRFLGRMLGKALYENLLVELPLAGFFLKKLISRAAGRVDINHLSSLDPELYRNLLFLRQNSSIADLALNFTTINNDFGEAQLIELKQDGRHINVTATNREEFIHLMADYKLNRQLFPQYHSFVQGLESVIPLEWLRMFNEVEIQVLISGARMPVDIEDLRHNTAYAGKFSAEHDSIALFWQVVSAFSEEEKSKLLKFVTSCSRPPLLGFKELHPKFCIQSAGDDHERLPTVSTCMNILKLPMYTSANTLHARLLYAITANAGFELS